jgi:perosamine synthetase
MNTKDMFWYPPAETSLSKKAIMQAMSGKAPEFSKELSSYLKVRQLVLGDSGRGLLAELLKSLKKTSPDKNEVLIPGYTCYSVAASVVNAGLLIRLYDIDPVTLAPDIESIEENLGSNTLGVLVQHLFGIPVQMDGIKDLMSRRGVWFIEDAAQGLGGSISGKPLGAVGDFGLYSFGRGKPLPLGSGGAVTGKHAEILEEINPDASGKGRSQVMKTAAMRMFSYPLIYGLLESLPLGLGKTVFDPAFTCKNMSGRINALGTLSLEYISDLNQHRRQIATVYSKNLNGMSVNVPENGIAVFTRFPVIAGARSIPLELRRLGVRRMYPKSIADEPQITPYLSGSPKSLAGARSVAATLLTLPTHKRITPQIAQMIAVILKEIY